MKRTHIRDADVSDLDTILALNRESECYLSPLDRTQLQHLHNQAVYHRVCIQDDGVGAFLLVLSEGADYDSPNYSWFCNRFERFLYVDRIVVDSRFHGQGMASQLYNDLIRFGRDRGAEHITCEYDVEPLNEVSKRLHGKLGFCEIGSHWINEGKKRVSLQVLSL